jgi:hypothetical protein
VFSMARDLAGIGAGAEAEDAATEEPAVN